MQYLNDNSWQIGLLYEKSESEQIIQSVRLKCLMYVDHNDQASPNSNNYTHLPIISMQLNNFIRNRIAINLYITSWVCPFLMYGIVVCALSQI